MKLDISLKTKDDVERFVLIVNIGLMAAIREGVISIEEAENYLYSSYSAERLKNQGINEQVVKLVELGCELEDVKSLIPDKLSKAIDEINRKSIELLNSIPKSLPPIKKWID